jgi:hypothetical protein
MAESFPMGDRRILVFIRYSELCDAISEREWWRELNCAVPLQSGYDLQPQSLPLGPFRGVIGSMSSIAELFDELEKLK